MTAKKAPFNGPFCIATLNEKGKVNPLTKCGQKITKVPAVTLDPNAVPGAEIHDACRTAG